MATPRSIAWSTVRAIWGSRPAVNLGAREATRDVLLLLNPDAIPAPGCFEALRRPPAAYAAWMGVVTLPGGDRVNTAGGESHYLGFSWVGGLDEPVSELPGDPYHAGFISGACLAVRLDVWREMGGFPDHFFLYFDDVDLSHRLRLSGRDFGVVPAARVEHDYVFDKGNRKWRNLERNRWATVIRTYPSALLVLVLPALAARRGRPPRRRGPGRLGLRQAPILAGCAALAATGRA